MARYDIYGIGGALVDTEVHVSDGFLMDKNIEKGVMTLVSESQQRDLLGFLASKNCQFVRKCGGSVCNSVVAAASLGASTFFSGKVADDIDGELYISDLNEAGVDFHSAGQEPGITGKCLVLVTGDAERTMNTFLGASDSLSSREIDWDALKNSDWFYVEGYLVTDEARKTTVKAAIKFAKANNVRIAISLSDPFLVEVFGDALRDLMDIGVDLIFCNKDEALAFTDEDDLDSAMQALKQFTETFVITDGRNGAVSFDGKSVVRAEGIAVQAIDTNGAGDMFAGVFLYAITSGKNYDWAARLANICAASVVEQFGPRLDLEVLTEIKKRFDA